MFAGHSAVCVGFPEACGEATLVVPSVLSNVRERTEAVIQIITSHYY